MKKRNYYQGILPAMQCPMKRNGKIDENELIRFTKWLASHKGVEGLVTNGHTGEIFSLTRSERAKVTKIVNDTVNGKLPVISGIACEGIIEGIEQAVELKEAGADGLLVMPYHHWLRFGYSDDHVIEYFTELGEKTNLNLIVHVYPAWTKAGYSSKLLGQLSKLKWVTTFKVGTREMSQYARDIKEIRKNSKNVKILTCHDEYLLASMVQGVDGALVGFASFIPELVVALFQAVKEGDLFKAQKIQEEILPLKEVVYSSGEPSGEAHARMKTAMYLAGRIKSDFVRRPIRKPTGKALEAIKNAVKNSKLKKI